MRRSPLPQSEITVARTALADAYLRTGDYDAADTILENALREAEAAGDRLCEAAALALQGMVLHFRAIELPREERAAVDSDPELDLFERALAIRRELGDPEGVAESLWQIGLVHQVLRRDSERAAPWFREALDLVDGLPDCDAWLRSEIHRHVGFDHLLSGRHDAALAELRESLEIRETLDEAGWCVGGLTALAAVSRQAGRRDDAIGYARRAAQVGRELGLRQRHLETAADELRAAEEMPPR